LSYLFLIIETEKVAQKIFESLFMQVLLIGILGIEGELDFEEFFE